MKIEKNKTELNHKTPWTTNYSYKIWSNNEDFVIKIINGNKIHKRESENFKSYIKKGENFILPENIEINFKIIFWHWILRFFNINQRLIASISSIIISLSLLIDLLVQIVNQGKGNSIMVLIFEIILIFLTASHLVHILVKYFFSWRNNDKLIKILKDKKIKIFPKGKNGKTLTIGEISLEITFKRSFRFLWMCKTPAFLSKYNISKIYDVKFYNSKQMTYKYIQRNKKSNSTMGFDFVSGSARINLLTNEGNYFTFDNSSNWGKMQIVDK